MVLRRLFAALLLIVTLLLIGLIFTDWLPYLRGPAPESSEWYWPYHLRPLDRWWAPVLAALVLLAVAAWWLGRREAQQRHAVMALTGLTAGSLLLQLALVYADRPQIAAELVDRTLSNLESGFFEPAAEIEDLHTMLRAYPQAMPGFVSEHARTHPPGLVVANWLTIRASAMLPGLSEAIARHVWPLRCTDLWLLNRPPSTAAGLALWAILPLLAAALTSVPTYLLARRLLSPGAVRLATVLGVTMPALLLFAPKSVQLYAPLSLFTLLAFHTGLERRSLFWLFLSGLTLSIATFLSLGNAALLLLLAVYAFLFLWQRERRQLTRRPGNWLPGHLVTCSQYAIAFTLGALSLWLIFWLGWGVAPWHIFQTGLQQHYSLVTLHRRYDWWLLYNLIDLLIYAGLPLMVGFAGMLIQAIKDLPGQKTGPAATLALALLVLILVLDISGSVRGEAGRLWLFFMPFIALAGGAFLARALPGSRTAILIVGLQLAITVTLGLAWRPVRAVIVVAEQPPMPATSPENIIDVSFLDEPITLHGYTLDASQATAGGFLDLTLYWQADGPALRPYTVFNHLVNAHQLSENQQPVAQQDNWPVNGQWPPTCWRQGENVVDSYRIELPADLAPGSYTLLAGLYDAFGESRLLTVNGQDTVPLANVTLIDDP